LSEPIYSHRFDNGLVLLAEPMRSVESAAFTLRVGAGTLYEPDDRGGLAGFACEMALRGAGPRDSRQFVDDLDNLGVERSESVTDGHTSYGGATLAKNLFPALEIYADVLRRAHLPAEQLEAGRQVVLQELRSLDDDLAQKVMLELRRRHYPDPWGRSSQGELASLESIVIDEIDGFYRRQYQPQDTILSVAGRLDWDEVRDHVERLFGDWAVQPKTTVTESEPHSRQHHIAHDANQTQIGIAYSSVPYDDDDFFRAWAAVGVLSGGMSSRLFTEVREKRGLCYTVSASHHTLLGRGAVMCYAGTSVERAQETLDVTLAELARLARGVEPNELDRLKARIKSGLIMQQESSSSRSSSIGRDWYLLGRVRTLDELESILDALTCDDINAYLADHPPRDFTIVTLGPEPLEVPVEVS